MFYVKVCCFCMKQKYLRTEKKLQNLRSFYKKMGALFAKMNYIDTTQSPYQKNIGGAMRIAEF